MHIASIPISLIDPNPHQPRKHFANINELAASIQERSRMRSGR